MKILVIAVLALGILALIMIQLIVISESLNKIFVAFGIEFGPFIQLASGLFLILIVLFYIRKKLS